MTQTQDAVRFPSPSIVPYRGGCVTEPAFFALDYLVKWRADVTVGGQAFTDVEVLPLLREVLADPARYGVSAADAEAARERFLDQAGQALVQEGGQRAWLEREFLPDR
ncbi:hypothetical protein [Deinococcus aquiradiocola]|uniref:Uncharacterized protein n=1 Tax=Deinococcus aquiradiocola TaxID=393059 RepID=A0A917P451_9DEIO|nr:hypothetical protein [Deinococcus aquiradiocola]GGJ60789.1 hypothetical protein GCM10008939_00670 [Deinococcus aquiradiocola]